MTPAQRAHAELFGKQFKSGTRLLDQLALVNQQVDFFGDPSAPPRELAAAVHDTACGADVAFSATIVSAVSHPVDNGTFLFTDYTARVTTVWRLASTAPAVQTQEIVLLTRPGGTMTVEGQTVTASHNLFPALELQRQYLILAKYFAATGAFVLSNPDGVYEIRGESAVRIGDADKTAAGIPMRGLENLRCK